MRVPAKPTKQYLKVKKRHLQEMVSSKHLAAQLYFSSIRQQKHLFSKYCNCIFKGNLTLLLGLIVFWMYFVDLLRIAKKAFSHPSIIFASELKFGTMQRHMHLQTTSQLRRIRAIFHSLTSIQTGHIKVRVRRLKQLEHHKQAWLLCQRSKQVPFFLCGSITTKHTHTIVIWGRDYGT